MWIFPLFIALDMKRTRTGWQFRFRVLIVV